MRETKTAQTYWLVTSMASALLVVTMGARQSLGLFVSPLNTTTGLGIAFISLAMAIGQFWPRPKPISRFICSPPASALHGLRRCHRRPVSWANWLARVVSPRSSGSRCCRTRSEESSARGWVVWRLCGKAIMIGCGAPILPSRSPRRYAIRRSANRTLRRN